MKIKFMLPVVLFGLLFAGCGGQVTTELAVENVIREENLIPPRGTYDHHYFISQEFDKFDSEYTVDLSPLAYEAENQKQGSLFASFSYPKGGPMMPFSVLFGFGSIHDELEYSQCYNLDLLLDDEHKISLDTLHRDDINEQGKFTEMVIGKLFVDDFLAIVNAEKVEGRICNDEFELTQDQMNALRDLASRMQ